MCKKLRQLRFVFVLLALFVATPAHADLSSFLQFLGCKIGFARVSGNEPHAKELAAQAEAIEQGDPSAIEPDVAFEALPEWSAEEKPLVEALEQGVGEIIGYLGRGNQAVIVVARDRKTGELAAYRLGTTKSSKPKEEGERLQALYEGYAAWAKAKGYPPGPNPMMRASYEPRAHAVKMEIVAKGNLAQHLGTFGTAHLDRSLEAIDQIARAVEYVNEQGIIHRDVKPDNFLCRADGTMVLADFGVAYTLAKPTGEESPRSIAGTPAYMNPDALRGRAPNATDDAKALRLTALEIVTGKRLDVYAHGLSEKGVGRFTTYAMSVSPHTLDSSIPIAISIAIWHPSQSAAAFLKLFDAARHYNTPGGGTDFIDKVYFPQYLAPLAKTHALSVANIIRNSRELTLAYNRGQLIFDSNSHGANVADFLGPPGKLGLSK